MQARSKRLVLFLLIAAVIGTVLFVNASLDEQYAASSGTNTSAFPRLSAPFGLGSGGGSAENGPAAQGNGMAVGQDYKHDESPPLRNIPPVAIRGRPEQEVNANPPAMLHHLNLPDPVVQTSLAPLAMPAATLNFDGIPFPGVVCNCAPPDTNGEVGATQYVQIVNEGYQVFNKTTGASQLGPVSITTIWSGFGGVCETNGNGDPVVLYDQIANRWLVSQFAGVSVPTDQCIAISTTSDATGAYFRYGFHLGSNFFDYPHLAVWPDAYYMSDNVFNSAGTAYLGPQPFAFDRAKMLSGQAASFISPVNPLGSTVDPILPADLDGSTLPSAGAPESFVQFPGAGAYTTYHFHVDFATPANSTWTTFANPTAAAFTLLCPTTRNCVPQSGTTSRLDAIADRPMFRLAYRNFGDHEAVVGNYTVSSGGVAGVRWFELRNVTSGPESVFQESTYQPDTTWRWMGSAAMDHQGNLAVGFSASSGTNNPQLRYAGRLATDPLNSLAQGEAHLFDGTGSQVGTSNRWGDYSDLTIDPVDDCTFWYTNEYYSTTGQFNWRTRIGSFKFATCTSGPVPTPTSTSTATPTSLPPTATFTPTSTPVLPPTSTPTPTSTPNPANVLRADSNVTGKGTGASFVATDLFARKDTVVVHIHVVDQNNVSLSGATVSLTVRKPGGAAQCTLTATTDSTGTAEASCKIPASAQIVGTWDSHVDNVTLTGYTYNASTSVTDHNFTVQ